MKRKPKPILDLTNSDGNAYMIIGRARRVAREAGWPDAEIEAFSKEASSGDYDHILQTCFKYFDVE